MRTVIFGLIKREIRHHSSVVVGQAADTSRQMQPSPDFGLFPRPKQSISIDSFDFRRISMYGVIARTLKI